MRIGARSLALSASVLAVALGCDSERAPTAQIGDEHNVLVIVLDACRADKLSAYGFERDTTPVLDAFANDSDAVLFRRYYTHASWTKPSTASLFTGRYVHEHGVTMNHGASSPYKSNLRARYRTQKLADGVETLAELLRAAGFETLGVVKSYHLVAEYGFAQGFDQYYGPDPAARESGRELDVALANRFIERLAERSGPTFGYLHLNTCHHPYRSSERDREYLRRYSFDYDEPARKQAGIDFTTAEIKRRIRSGEITLSRDDVRFLNLVYEAKLRTGDRLVGEIFGALRSLGIYDESLIMVTADHGEELYDHGDYAHSHALWNEVIQVPLIVKFPLGEKPSWLPMVSDELANTVDLMPTILSLVGAPRPAGLVGRSLFHDPEPAFVFAEHASHKTPEGPIEQWAVIERDAKLIERSRAAMLFRLPDDAHEQSSLAAAEPGRLARMRDLGQRALSAERAGPRAPVIDTELDPAAVEQLKELGYLSGEE